MVESGSHTPFRDSIRHAPEVSQPFIANTPVGVQKWPFKEIKRGKNASSKETVVFEARSVPHEELNPQIVRVSYEESYGLKAKRTLVLVRPSGSEFLFSGGNIRYESGEIVISYSLNLSGPFLTEDLLRDTNQFEASILVTNAMDPNVPPLAWIQYNPSQKIPIDVRFPYADFQQALKGDVEKRERQQFGSASYKQTYFQWEHLVGAKIGASKYDSAIDTTIPMYYAHRTSINNREPVHIKNTPYEGKITRSESRIFPGVGRLRFSRMNEETGESWMFSVPDLMDRNMLFREIQHSALRDFFYQYPIIFCVKNRGEERQWHSTWGQIDKAR